MMVPDILLKDLSFYYQQHALFAGLHLSLPRHSCTVLLGSSGIGKTTLLHLMIGAALDAHSSFSGEILTSDGLPLLGRIMLMTPQDGLLPWLNVLENVLLGYRLRRAVTPEITQRALTLLRQLGLTEKDWHKKPKALSGGMRQRVALARLVIEDKPIWLLDEPFSAVDALTRYKLQNDIVELWQDKTVLMVTHDPLEALRLADFIYVMHGTPARLTAIELPKTQTPRMITAELITYQNQIFSLLGTK